MALKNTCKSMEVLLEAIHKDLEKVAEGNKAAAQRVRTNTILFAKVAKEYRKESVHAAKSGAMQRTKKTSSKVKGEAKKRAPAKKKAPSKKVAAKKGAAKKKQAVKKKVVESRRPVVRRSAARKPEAKKRVTAKLPKKGAAVKRG